MFHDAPGTPPDLRCVGCKYTAATAGFALSAAGVYKTIKIINPRPYLGLSLALATFATISVSGIILRFGMEDQKYNQMRLREHAAEIKKKRRQESGVDKEQSST